ncbi:MAG TPA: hypothetical protein VF755_01580 [Catenuloplanes sp.]|jgi:hypothetical protein
MLGNAIGSRLAVGTATTVIAVVGALVLPTPAYAAYRQRAESPRDTTASKTATAACLGGEVLIGAGGRINDGQGGVALTAVVPAQNSVTVRGDALAGHHGTWSVIAVAVCQSASIGAAGVVSGQLGSPSTATCADGARLRGTGFALPPGAVLTSLLPSLNDASVTVRTPAIPVGAAPPVAYAICVRQLPVSHRLRDYQRSSPVDAAAAQTVAADRGATYEFPQMSAVGGEVSWADRSPTDRPEVFLDTLMPDEDLSSVTVQAVRRPAGPTGRPVPGRAGGAPPEDPAQDQWSTTAHAIGDVYYY